MIIILVKTRLMVFVRRGIFGQKLPLLILSIGCWIRLENTPDWTNTTHGLSAPRFKIGQTSQLAHYLSL